MRKKENTNRKFTLEKFEIAKLKNLYLIKGGFGNNDPDNGGGVYIDTKTSTNCAQATSKDCLANP